MYDMHGSGHLTGLQHVRQVFRLFRGKVSGNLRAATRDLIVHTRSGVHHLIQDDRDLMTDILFRQASPFLRSLGVHHHIHHLLGTTALLHKVGVRVGYHVATQCRATIPVRHLQGVQLEELLTLVDRFHAPFQRQITRQDLLHLLHVQVLVDLLHILRLRDTYGSARRQLTIVLANLQQSEQRVLLREFLHALVRLRIRRRLLTNLGQQRIRLAYVRLRVGSLGGFLLGRRRHLRAIRLGSAQDRSQHVVGRYQLLVNLRQLIGLPKLQVRTTLQQLTHTLRLFHARQLDQDTSRRLQPLNVRGNHTETVDTRTQHVERIIDRALQLLLQHGDHLRVRALGSNLIF